MDSKDFTDRIYLYIQKIINAKNNDFVKLMNLANLDLTRDFINADLQGVDLHDAKLEEANFEGADLRGADLKRANLKSANFEGANLKCANFEGANLEGTNLKGTSPKEANFKDANLKNANIFNVNFENTNLEGANFSGTIKYIIKGKRILVPTDNSENSREAFRYAIGLAEKFQSKIHVLYVIDRGYLEHGYDPRVLDDLEEHLFEEKTKETKEFINKNTKNKEGLHIEMSIKSGNPFVEIITTAREKEADLIVMGTHGRTGLSHVLMGSVTKKVVRKAPCPVLTIKPNSV